MRILLTGDYFNNYQIDKKDFIELKKNFQRYDFVVLNYEGTFKSKFKLNKSIHLSMSQNSLNLPKIVFLIFVITIFMISVKLD